ncbi:hypothetical protein K7432_013627 [Basidiobolus ranarum]|uniref:Major facilitator superfamily (MFS) profile domain-containing protein n=1 Tax=Basidiobolus ranarum TaxID=34480 RepID=A0ABR2VQI0_9FUNG
MTDTKVEFDKAEVLDRAHEEQFEERTFLRIFSLRPHIKPINFIAFLLAVAFSICFVVYVGASQAFVLTDIIKVDSGNIGNITGSLGLYDEILSIIMVVLWGTLSDRIGRRPIYVLGFFLTSISILAFTTAREVYPGLLLLRLLFAAGSSACTSMMTAMLGDCLSNKRGRVTGVVGLFSGIGALFAVGVLLPLPARFTSLYNGDSEKAIKTSFYTVGGVVLCLSVFLWFTLPKDKDRASRRAEASKPKENMFILLKKGFLAGKDPRVALGYISSFVARADTVVVSTFISLWVAQYYLDNNLCESEGKASCPRAYNIASRLSGIAQACAIIGAPIFGILSDRLRRTTTTLIAGVFGIIGCFPFAFNKNPLTGINNFWAVLIGFGQIGMIVTSLILVNGPYVDEEIRGSVAGVYSFFGALAVMVVNKLGGWLFDEWMQGAPFVLLGICHAIIVAFALFTRLRENKLDATEHEMHNHRADEYSLN